MAGVGLRSEQQHDKDNSERAKRNLGKDLGDMEVDAGADRPAKDKPVETTPQVTKKTKKDEEQKGAAAEGVAEGVQLPRTSPSRHPKAGLKSQAQDRRPSLSRGPEEVGADRGAMREGGHPQCRQV